MRKIYIYGFTITLILFRFLVEAQTVNNTEKLMQLSNEFKARDAVRKAEMQKLAKQYDLPIIMNGIDGQTSELRYFENGHPRYYTTSNLDAAKTIATNRVWPSGGSGLNLNGSSQILGEWDAGGVRLTHQELSGRVTQMDSPSSLHDHSTHVAGTMIASGVVSTAIGMSFAGTLHAWDWNSDDAEMAAAAATGLKVSNHSYGYIAGWYSNGANWYWYGDVDVSLTEDAGFGFYDATANDWDNIAYNAPGYLIAKSADNNRGEGPSPGTGHYYWNGAAWTWSTVTRDKDGGTLGYDCIPYYATAKNILTVGAVNDIVAGYSIPADVVMSTFSGWGPTDDGRIKPDIVANGIGVYSSLSSGDATYANYNGTSMATPSVAGSVGLILQHKENLDGGSEAMLSATIKGLIIHTADEAGTNNGPDYVFGWGLMNTETATEVMTTDNSNGGNFNIRELNLANGGTFQTTVYADGSSPLRTTLVWTDPAGTPAAWSLDPTTAMLVNDLDMRLTNVTPTTYYPYILDPANPANAATTGDNFRDNVEQIYKTGTTYGEAYTLTITHKGSLSGGSQNFSLIISGIIPNPTYTWIGASGGSWSIASNWSPARTSPGNDDILLFNDGVTYTITAVPTQTIGQLAVSNNSKITLQAVSSPNTLSISGSTGTDITVESGAELNISGANVLTVQLAATSIAAINGNMTFAGGAHKFTGAGAGSIAFGSGSVFTASTGFTGNAFGSSAPYNAVIFTNGSVYLHGAGSDPFAAAQPNSLVVFQTGSLYKLTGDIDPSMDGRTYANMEVDATGFTIDGNGSAAVTVNNLTITNGVFNLNMTGTPGHAIKGNISVAAGATLTFSPAGSGTMNLNGSSSQTIIGSGTITGNANTSLVIDNQVIADNNMYLSGSLSINNSKSLTINAGKQITVESVLTNNAGITGLVLKSTATGTASLLHNTNDIQATVERYITGSEILTNMTYHQVSIPVGASANPTSNLFLGSYLYGFTEGGSTTGQWTSMGSGTTTTLDVDKGYLVYYPGSTPTTYSFTGPLRNGTITPALSYTDANHGFNLIPNPYPSAIDWDATSGWSLSHVNDAIYIWNSDESIVNYGSYIGSTSTNGVTSIIPTGQAFFVRTNAAAPAISMTNNVRVHDSKLFMKKGTLTNPYELHLFAHAGEITDEIAIRFDEDATLNFDSHADAYKFFGNAASPQLNSVTPDGTKLSINSLPFSTVTTVVPLNFSLDAVSEVTLSATGIETFDQTVNIFLEDKLLNRMINLRETPAYNFTHTESNDMRFNLYFYGVIGMEEQGTTKDFRIWSAREILSVYIPELTGQYAVVEMYDLLGHLVMSRQVVLGSPTQLTVPQFNGLGLVRVITNEAVFSKKVMIH